MEIFNIYFSRAELYFLGGLLLTFIYQIYFYFHYINGVIHYRKKIQHHKISFLKEQPPVSVIICAKNEAENLSKFLPAILEQDYPDFEVIVINDGSVDDTDILLGTFSKKNSNLRTTFVPQEAQNLSTKKLGLTLGIKAAKNDLLLFTDADCVPASDKWIKLMVRNFLPDIEFVLGYSGYSSQKGFLNQLITYDTLFIGLQYMGMALAGKPYMGVGRNLAYRKQTFFDQNGFASSLNLLAGDDDLIVNRAANKKNTRVEISPESITWSQPKTTFKSWYQQKRRHLSVSSAYTKKSKWRLMLEPLTRGLFYILLIVTCIVGNNITKIFAVFLFLIRYAIQISIINRSARHFKERQYFLTLLIFDLLLPLIPLSILVTNRKSSRYNQKW